MSKIQVDEIISVDGTGSPEFPNGIRVDEIVNSTNDGPVSAPQGVIISGGTPITTLTTGTWSPVVGAGSGGNANIGSVSITNATFQQTNGLVKARLIINGLAPNTAPNDVSISITTAGLPGYVNATIPLVTGSAGQSNGTILVPCTVRGAANNAGDTLIGISVENNQGNTNAFFGLALIIEYTV